nr:MAG TPA: PlnF plnF, TOXIN [Caudoviricetes sp.]
MYITGRYDWIISAFRANMYLPKGKTKKTEEQNHEED